MQWRVWYMVIFLLVSTGTTGCKFRLPPEEKKNEDIAPLNDDLKPEVGDEETSEEPLEPGAGGDPVTTSGDASSDSPVASTPQAQSCPYQAQVINCLQLCTHLVEAIEQECIVGDLIEDDSLVQLYSIIAGRLEETEDGVEAMFSCDRACVPSNVVTEGQWHCLQASLNLDCSRAIDCTAAACP